MINDKYSRKDFTGKVFLEVDSNEFSNTTIVGSCFSQQSYKGKDIKIFPDGIYNVRFERCNLDNVEIPEGCVLDNRCSNRSFLAQKDGFDWEIDKNTKKVVKPLNSKIFKQNKWSVNPNNIYDAKGKVRKIKEGV